MDLENTRKQKTKTKKTQNAKINFAHMTEIHVWKSEGRAEKYLHFIWYLFR